VVLYNLYSRLPLSWKLVSDTAPFDGHAVISTKVSPGMKLRLLILASLLVLFVSACAPAIELRNPGYLQDTSLISGEPCAAPCWRGIIPGETEWGDALARLQDDPTLQDVKEQQSEESSEIAASFQRRDGVPCCLIYSRDGTLVDQILLQLAPDITVAEVLEVYGEPQYVSGAEVSAEQASLALYYPENQMVVYAFVAGKETGELTPQSEVFAVLYVRERDMTEVIEYSPLYNWEGYKTYAAYIDEQYDKTAVPTPLPDATEEAGVDATDEASATEEAVAMGAKG
jgi:hypothetical protein